MPPRLSTIARRVGWLYPAVLFVAFVVAAGGGYVYSYDPAPDQLVLRVDRTAPAGVEIVPGTVVEYGSNRLVLESGGDRVEIDLPTDTPVDELRLAGDAFAPGTPVNVGVENTAYGLVLTGLVAVEDAP